MLDFLYNKLYNHKYNLEKNTEITILYTQYSFKGEKICQNILVQTDSEGKRIKHLQ